MKAGWMTFSQTFSLRSGYSGIVVVWNIGNGNIRYVHHLMLIKIKGEIKFKNFSFFLVFQLRQAMATALILKES